MKKIGSIPFTKMTFGSLIGTIVVFPGILCGQTTTLNVITPASGNYFSLNLNQTSTDGNTTSPGFQFNLSGQVLGGTFGEGGNLTFEGNSASDTAFSGGSIFLGGSARGDWQKSQVTINGNIALGASTQTPIGIVVDGQDHGQGIANNVGIGLVPGTYPAAKLEVNGNLRLTSGSGALITYADGTVQSTAWNGTTFGGDYAESVDVRGDRASYEPGDVIVIDAGSSGKFLKSGKAYSKLVAGVYSTKPGLVGRRVTFERLDKAAEVPMAMVGIVPTKVSTENGAIEPGDLLVSSSKPGYAMKGTDPIRLTGAILGKALAPLSSGDGVIEVMISIQ